MEIDVISPQSLAAAAQEHGRIELIDVRTPAEFCEAHIPAARNVPLDQLDPAAIRRQRQGSGEPLYVVCHLGMRSQQACEILAAAGLTKVVNVAGGTQAWAEAGLPLVFHGPVDG